MRRHGNGSLTLGSIVNATLLFLVPDVASAQDSKSGIYRFEYVTIHRGYVNFAKEDKFLTPTKDEKISVRPGKFEISATRSWYGNKLVLTVSGAPETVVEGQEVTLRSDVVATFVLKEKNTSYEPYATAAVGNYGSQRERKTTTVSSKSPLNPGVHTIQVAKTGKARVHRDDSLFFVTPARGIYPRYARFSASASCALTGQLILETTWFYKYEGDPAPKPKSGPPSGTLAKQEELAGPWQSLAGDEEWQITRQGDHYAGYLTKVPAFLREFTFSAGEQTLRGCTRTGANTFKGEVLWRFSGGLNKPPEWKAHTLTIASERLTLDPPLRVYVRTKAKSEPSGGTLALSLPDHFVAGKPFIVTARVTNAQPDQALTLSLGPKLERLEGAERQVVPSSTKEATLTWKVQALEPGRFNISVRSSTGVDERKSITISPAKQNYTLLDAQRALKMGVGTIPEEVELDVDGSGFVNSGDALLILQMAGARLEKQR